MKKTGMTMIALVAALGLFAGCAGQKPEESKQETEASMTEELTTEEATEGTTEEVTEPAVPELTDGMYTMGSLEGWAKFRNRYMILRNGAMAADWSGSGFTLIVESEGGEFVIYYKTEYAVYISVHVDGEEAARPCLEVGEGSTSVPLTAGIHEVSVYKETEISPTGKAFNLNGVFFEGRLLPKPEDLPLIEYIGDSIACGDGSLGVYKSGEVWSSADHSATHGFPFFLSRMTGTDYSVVAKGGIGVVNTSGGFSMGLLYPFVTGYRDHVTEYDFAKVPDLVVLEMGANDTGHPEIEYYNALSALIRFIREKYGKEVPIVWVGRTERNYDAMKRYMMTVKKEDSNLYAMQYHFVGKGSAALATQSAGHPDAEEQLGLATEIFEFLKEKQLLPGTEP